MNYRKYNPKTDKEAVHRIWHECGWVDSIKEDDTKPMDTLIDSSRTIVADINKEPECLVVSYFGDIKYLGEELKFSCIAGVTTSLIARRQRLAANLTAAKIALDAQEGALVSGLGIFEQGYYDKLGYGSGGYEHLIRFSPSTLNVNIEPRVPVRLSKDDFKIIHQSRLDRLRVHGSCNFESSANTNADMNWSKNSCGYGYVNDKGELTHHFWMSGMGKENGPFHIWWMVFQNYDQFLELMALLKSFGEQIDLITMKEPPRIQFQDLLNKPIWYQRITKKSETANFNRALSYWQLRICDLVGCLEKTHLSGETVKFNLKLSDPIQKYLDNDIKWQGVGGEYVVTLGSDSKAEIGSDNKLPTMEASVGAFTRMWLGALPATSLTVTDQLSAPTELLTKLDKLLLLPTPKVDWDF